MKIKVFNSENSKPKKKKNRARQKGKEKEEGREGERGRRETIVLLREFVNSLIIFINSIINKTAGNDLDSILQGRK